MSAGDERGRAASRCRMRQRAGSLAGAPVTSRVGRPVATRRARRRRGCTVASSPRNDAAAASGRERRAPSALPPRAAPLCAAAALSSRDAAGAASDPAATARRPQRAMGRRRRVQAQSAGARGAARGRRRAAAAASARAASTPRGAHMKPPARDRPATRPSPQRQPRGVAAAQRRSRRGRPPPLRACAIAMPRSGAAVRRRRAAHAPRLPLAREPALERRCSAGEGGDAAACWRSRTARAARRRAARAAARSGAHERRAPRRRAGRTLLVAAGWQRDAGHMPMVEIRGESACTCAWMHMWWSAPDGVCTATYKIFRQFVLASRSPGRSAAHTGTSPIRTRIFWCVLVAPPRRSDLLGSACLVLLALVSVGPPRTETVLRRVVATIGSY
jgi:hypothetical protein